MQKKNLVLIAAMGALMLSACSGSRQTGTGFRNGARLSGPLTPEQRLALGTVRLEGTPNAVDAAAAAKLLPLWQLLGQLNSSSSSAPQEIAAVLDQIKSTMTPAQVKAIDEMQITQADIFTSLQGQSQQNRTGGSAASGTARSSTPSNGGTRTGNGNFQFFAGGVPGGGSGFGGAARNGGSTSTGSSQTQTSPAQRAQELSSAASGILVNEVIRLLESKVGTG